MEKGLGGGGGRGQSLFNFSDLKILVLFCEAIYQNGRDYFFTWWRRGCGRSQSLFNFSDLKILVFKDLLFWGL